MEICRFQNDSCYGAIGIIQTYGGAAGKPGANGSIISGPLNTANCEIITERKMATVTAITQAGPARLIRESVLPVEVPINTKGNIIKKLLKVRLL